MRYFNVHCATASAVSVRSLEAVRFQYDSLGKRAFAFASVPPGQALFGDSDEENDINVFVALRSAHGSEDEAVQVVQSIREWGLRDLKAKGVEEVLFEEIYDCSGDCRGSRGTDQALLQAFHLHVLKQLSFLNKHGFYAERLAPRQTSWENARSIAGMTPYAASAAVELDRIRTTAGVNTARIAAHYLIGGSLGYDVDQMVDVLVGALYEAGRVQSRRVWWARPCARRGC